MSLPIFPTFLGLSYPVMKRPAFNNIVQRSTSGIRTAIANWTYTLYDWDLPFDWLSAAAAQADYQKLSAFFEQVYGNFSPFLFDDLTDDFTTASQALKSNSGMLTPGVGDGVTTTFQLARSLNSNVTCVPIYYTKSTPTRLIYLNGVLQSGGSYSISSLGLVTFVSAPGAGVVVTATFGYYWPVTCLEMNTEFENFASNLWHNKKLTLRQIRVTGS